MENTELKPIAYMHVMLMERGQTHKSLSFKPEPEDSFGKPGENYSEDYTVYSIPLYELKLD